MEQENTGLKPCPFCGSDNLMLYRSMTIVCNNCHIVMKHWGFISGPIEDKWNRRAELSESDILAIVNGWLDSERFMCDLPQDE